MYMYTNPPGPNIISVRLVLPLEAWQGGVADSFPLFMTPGSGGTALVGLRSAPFSWFTLGKDGSLSPPANPLTLVPEAGLSGPWYSTSLVGLGRAVLQVLADASSVRRDILLFTPKGGPVRAIRLGLPIGFLAANVNRRELLALRRTDRLELVTYKWSWIEGPGQSTIH